MERHEYTLATLAAVLLFLPLVQFGFMLFFEGFEGAYTLAFGAAAVLGALLWLYAEVQLNNPESPRGLWFYGGVAAIATIASWLGSVAFAFYAEGVTDSGHGASLIFLVLGTAGVALAMTCRYSVLVRRTLTSRSTRRANARG